MRGRGRGQSRLLLSRFAFENSVSVRHMYRIVRDGLRILGEMPSCPRLAGTDTRYGEITI
jgi:hypothetical protein